MSFLPVAREIVSDRFVQVELKREEARLAEHQRHTQAGVRWSGMELEPFAARTVAQIVADADKARAKAEAFAASPRGVFLDALKRMEAMPKYAAKARELRGVYDRDLADERRPLNVKAVACAQIVLNAIPGQASRDASDALADLILQEARS